MREGKWILGGLSGFAGDDERGTRSLQEHRDGIWMCEVMCDEMEVRSCPRMGVPCESYWDRYEEPKRTVVQTWGFVEDCLALGLGVPKLPLAE